MSSAWSSPLSTAGARWIPARRFRIAAWRAGPVVTTPSGSRLPRPSAIEPGDYVVGRRLRQQASESVMRNESTLSIATCRGSANRLGQHADQLVASGPARVLPVAQARGSGWALVRARAASCIERRLLSRCGVPPCTLVFAWGSRGRRFESGRPDHFGHTPFHGMREFSPDAEMCNPCARNQVLPMCREAQLA
jgi:hypothetical protein